MRHWAESYVGLPYADFDCAELCRKVQIEQFNKILTIPEYRCKGLHSVSKMIDNLQDDFATIVSKPIEGDAVLMIGKGRINHIGIACYINNQLFVLHAMRNAGMTVLHNIVSLGAIGLKVEGYYQWK
jgi:hypothetical protein